MSPLWFLAFSKAEAVFSVLKGEDDKNKYPAQLIKPVHGDLTWFLDTEAASLLSE